MAPHRARRSRKPTRSRARSAPTRRSRSPAKRASSRCRSDVHGAVLHLVARQTVSLPAAYLVPAGWTVVIDTLREHHLRTKRVAAPPTNTSPFPRSRNHRRHASHIPRALAVVRDATRRPLPDRPPRRRRPRALARGHALKRAGSLARRQPHPSSCMTEPKNSSSTRFATPSSTCTGSTMCANLIDSASEQRPIASSRAGIGGASPVSSQ